MARKAPGKHHRQGMSLTEIVELFPDDAAAERWSTEIRWPDGPHCPYCGSVNVLSGASHKTMPYRCREKECRKRFSVRTKSALEASNVPYRKWAIAFYLFATNLKGISSMKLHRDLTVTQKTAWFMAHRIREACEGNHGLFSGPVEVDESYFGGRERNKHANKKQRMGRGAVGKIAVAGAKDRKTNRVSAEVVPATDRETLQAFVADKAAPGATVYTDEAKAYKGMPFNHETVRHSTGEYVRGMASTQGIESFWATLKRAQMGTFHKISPKHLQRYVNEFTGRHDIRSADTIVQMGVLVHCMIGERLKYQDLIADNGLDSGARSE